MNKQAFNLALDTVDRLQNERDALQQSNARLKEEAEARLKQLLAQTEIHNRNTREWRVALDTAQAENARLREALEMLIRESQEVADDHHRPRYRRLDQALESANRTLKK